MFSLACIIVSVSLRSIIHSYMMKQLEYSSLQALKFPSPCGVLFILIKNNLSWLKMEHLVGFRLLTEYYSFLYLRKVLKRKEELNAFPSPYGVSFILIMSLKKLL